METADTAAASSVDRPRLVDGMSAWVFFPATRHKPAIYAVGSPERDRYLAVPEPAMRTMTKVLNYFDGTRSVSEIQEQAGDVLLVRLNVPGLCKKLDDAGLLASGAGGAGDVTRMSAVLVDTTLPQWAIATAFIPRALSRAAFWIAAGVCIWAAGVLSAHGTARLPGATPFVHATTFLMALLICAVSIAAHEVAHIWAATFFGLRTVRMKVLLYLGFVPLVAVKFKGLYTLPRTHRLIVWSAGIYANVTIAALAMLLIRASALPAGLAAAAESIVLVNVFMAAFNLCPFLPTDGYFIACTLLRQFNVRTRAYYTLRDIARLTRAREISPWVVTYLIATVAVFAFVVLKQAQIFWHFGAHSSGERLGAVLGALLVTWMLIQRAFRARAKVV